MHFWAFEAEDTQPWRGPVRLSHSLTRGWVLSVRVGKETWSNVWWQA